MYIYETPKKILMSKILEFYNLIVLSIDISISVLFDLKLVDFGASQVTIPYKKAKKNNCQIISNISKMTHLNSLRIKYTTDCAYLLI